MIVSTRRDREKGGNAAVVALDAGWSNSDRHFDICIEQWPGGRRGLELLRFSWARSIAFAANCFRGGHFAQRAEWRW